MCKKDIIAMLSLAMLGLTAWDIQDYNSQSQALLSAKVDKQKYETNTNKVKKIVDECEKYKREEYINQKVEELRAEKERIRLEEEERKRKEEEEQRRQQEEQVRLEQERAVVNRGGDIPNGRVVDVEVSFYCSCSQCCAGGSGITASGKHVQEGMIACPSDIPFGTRILIDGVTYTCEDTGSYIKWINGIMRVDIYTSSHTEALKRGRYTTKAIILD